jgi:hypothetical protein
MIYIVSYTHNNARALPDLILILIGMNPRQYIGAKQQTGERNKGVWTGPPILIDGPALDRRVGPRVTPNPCNYRSSSSL